MYTREEADDEEGDGLHFGHVELDIESYETFKGGYQSGQLVRQAWSPGGQPDSGWMAASPHALFGDAGVFCGPWEAPRCGERLRKTRANFFPLISSPFPI